MLGFHVSTFIAPFIIIKLKIEITTVVQHWPATWVFSPFSCPKVFCAQHLNLKFFPGIDPRPLKPKPKSIILIPASCSTLPLLALINSQLPSSLTISLAPPYSGHKF